MADTIKIFEDKRIRVEWDTENEKWHFSIVDIVAVLTESPIVLANIGVS